MRDHDTSSSRAAGIALLIAAAALSLASLSIGAAHAQSYPVKPVRLIIPYPPGGSNDLVGRIIAAKLDEMWGQRVLVDNRSGGNGLIGTQAVARAAPDGYTLLLVPAAHAINATLQPNLPYDPVKDFAPVTNIASAPNVLVVHPSLPVRTVSDLIALAKQRPGQLNYGSAGIGFPSHLAAEMLDSMAGIKMVHVPYKGSGPAIVDLMSGNIQLSFPSLPAVVAHIRTGRLRALAVTSEKRSSLMPELPRVADTIPGYAAETWFGIFAPAATPREVVAKLNADIVRLVHEPEVKALLSKQGADPIGNSPEAFSAYVRAEIAKWAKVIKAAGIHAE